MQPSATTAMSHGVSAFATTTAPAPPCGSAANAACTASGPPVRMRSRPSEQTSEARVAPFVFSSTYPPAGQLLSAPPFPSSPRAVSSAQLGRWEDE